MPNSATEALVNALTDGEIVSLRREVADLKLQMVAMHENERKRVAQEAIVIKRMPMTEAIRIYPTYGEMLGYLLRRGNLPSWSKLTMKQQDAVCAALGIGCGIETVYNRLRKAINNQTVRRLK